MSFAAEPPDRAHAVWTWEPPPGARRVVTVESHTEGEPLRVILSGFPELGGESIRQRRAAARTHHDGIRRALMWEPRGHADMYGCIVTAPERPDSDLGVLFTHNEGYSTMCGHGILAVTRVVVELGLVPVTEPETRLVIDTPAGPVRARASVHGGRVKDVSFRNVPSWVAALDRTVEVAGLGSVRYDLAFGGAFYAYVRADDVGLELEPSWTDRIIAAGRAIKDAVARTAPPVHPEGPDLSFLYGTIFVSEAFDPAHHSRNVCVFADGEVDRSPTGTGVSGRLALHHARGEVAVGETLIIESLIGSRFACRIVEEIAGPGGRAAVVPEVEGRAYITGRSEWIIDASDPLAEGFLLR